MASGCGGTGRELAAYGALGDLGGFVTRSITLNPRPGGPLPRIVETPSGLVHAVGLQNPGLEPFLATELPWLVQQGTRVVVSIAGGSLGEYAELARRLGRAPGVAAIEVNLSSPDAPARGCSTCASRSTPPASSRPCTATCRAGCRCWPSCRTDVVRVVESARTVLEAGAAAVVVGNALPAAMPDGRQAGLSGPAIRPLALRCVTEVRAGLPDAQIVGVRWHRHRRRRRARSWRRVRRPSRSAPRCCTTPPRPRASWPTSSRHRPPPRGSRMTFGTRVHAAIAARGPLCAGIDPHAALLREWGLADDVAGLERFALTAVEGLAPHVSVVKPQSAFYERFGSRGIAVLERVIAESRAAGALVLLDVKRGDIGSTSQAYADAYLDPSSPLASDAITVSPYLGFGSLDPLVETARRHGAGVFVLALTSNKEGPEVQHAHAPADGGTVAGDHARPPARRSTTAPSRWARSARSSAPRSATPAERLDINGPLLAPGYGAQGGTVDDLRRIFGAAARAVLPSSSRELLRHGPDVRALADAARRANDELRGAGRMRAARDRCGVPAGAAPAARGLRPTAGRPTARRWRSTRRS